MGTTIADDDDDDDDGMLFVMPILNIDDFNFFFEGDVFDDGIVVV